jgi:hypothetical protein
MLVYKIVSLQNGKFFSPVMSGKAKLEYIIGHEVEVPEWLSDAGLFPFVYHNLDLAVSFLQNDEVILECEASEQVPLPYPHSWLRLERGLLGERKIDPKKYFGSEVFSYKTIIPIRRV